MGDYGEIPVPDMDMGSIAIRSGVDGGGRKDSGDTPFLDRNWTVEFHGPRVENAGIPPLFSNSILQFSIKRCMIIRVNKADGPLR